MSLGENIYKLRTQKNMSQGALADALEISRQSVSKWENDSAVPELDKLQKMSKLFDVTLDELVNGEQTSTSAPPPQTIILHRPEKNPMPRHRLIGLVLLACGFLTFLVFTIFGYYEGNVYLGALFSFPLFFDGIVCLLSEKHTLFSLLWANQILFLLFVFLIAIRSVGNSAQGILVFSFALLALLTAWSLWKLYRGHFNAGRIKKAVWTAVLLLLLAAHLFLVLMPKNGGLVVTDEEVGDTYVYVE